MLGALLRLCVVIGVKLSVPAQCSSNTANLMRITHLIGTKTFTTNVNSTGNYYFEITYNISSNSQLIKVTFNGSSTQGATVAGSNMIYRTTNFGVTSTGNKALTIEAASGVTITKVVAVLVGGNPVPTNTTTPSVPTNTPPVVPTNTPSSGAINIPSTVTTTSFTGTKNFTVNATSTGNYYFDVYYTTSNNSQLIKVTFDASSTQGATVAGSNMIFQTINFTVTSIGNKTLTIEAASSVTINRVVASKR